MERAVGRSHLIVGILSVKHAEAVVMLRRKDEIPESVACGDVRPFFRIDADRIEAFVQIDILLSERFSVVLPGNIIPRPYGVFF